MLKKTCGHAVLNRELCMMPSGQVENRNISIGEEDTSYWRVGLAVSFYTYSFMNESVLLSTALSVRDVCGSRPEF
jgi:hypothetical protein